VRKLMIFIGVLGVAGVAILAAVYGLQTFAPQQDHGEQPNQSSTSQSEGSSNETTRRPCEGSDCNMEPPEPVEIPEVEPQLPETMPRVDPDGRTREITNDVRPGPLSSTLEECRSNPKLILRTAPQYPGTPVRRELEGDVTLEFTITKSGNVRDIRVISSTNSRFERSAARAVGRWKYEPCIIDGRPTEVPGVRATIEFRVGNDEEE
jgi:protein TonB